MDRFHSFRVKNRDFIFDGHSLSIACFSKNKCQFYHCSKNSFTTYLNKVYNKELKFQNDLSYVLNEIENYTFDIMSVSHIYNFIFKNTNCDIDIAKKNIGNLIAFIRKLTKEVKYIEIGFDYENSVSSFLIQEINTEIVDKYIYFYIIIDSTKSGENNIYKMVDDLLVKGEKSQSKLPDISFVAKELEESYSDVETYENLKTVLLNLHNFKQKIMPCSSLLNSICIDIDKCSYSKCYYKSTDHVITDETYLKSEKFKRISQSCLNNDKCKRCWCRFLCGGECEENTNNCEDLMKAYEYSIYIYCMLYVKHNEFLLRLNKTKSKGNCMKSFRAEEMITINIDL